MARSVTPLTDSRIRQAAPGIKPIKLADGGGSFGEDGHDGLRGSA